MDEGKNNVAHRCEGEGGRENALYHFFWRDGRRVETKLKRVHEFLIKKHRTIFPFFVPLMDENLRFKTTNVKWLFEIMTNIYRIVISLRNQLNFLDCIS